VKRRRRNAGRLPEPCTSRRRRGSSDLPTADLEDRHARGSSTIVRGDPTDRHPDAPGRGSSATRAPVHSWFCSAAVPARQIAAPRKTDPATPSSACLPRTPNAVWYAAASLAWLRSARPLIGEVDGVRLMEPATVDQARTPQPDQLPTHFPLRFGLGYEAGQWRRCQPSRHLFRTVAASASPDAKRTATEVFDLG
jgi:hypothetical protein